MRKLTAVKLPHLHLLTWAHDLIDLVLCSLRDVVVIVYGM